MIIFPVHDGDIDRQLRQVHGRVDAGKAAAQYDDPVAPCTVSSCRRFCHRSALPSIPRQVQPLTGRMPKGHVQLILFALPCYLFDALILFGFHRRRIVRGA